MEKRARLTRAIADEAWPCAVVDLDAFERNVKRIVAIATAHGKKLRIATKSIRVPELVRRIHAAAPGIGLMTYTARETAYLHEQGYDDLLLAYPTARRADADLVARTARSAEVSMVVDDVAHLEVLDAAARDAGVAVDVIVEVDMAFRPLDRVHLGVRRSPLRETADVLAFVDRIATFGSLRFRGIMGYEAQIAGLGDDMPGGVAARLTSVAVRALKSRSRVQVERMRHDIVTALRDRGTPPAIVNGGGTGNLTWCAAEPVLTEVTAGSGFLGSHLFDRYREVRPEPAVYFALQVVRAPAKGIVTCFGGGYVASGEAGGDRLPIPSLPEGLTLLAREGAGEVQTPLRLAPGLELAIGEPVFFRHAKTGELAEHFAEYLLVRGDRIESRALTYRGLGR